MDREAQYEDDERIDQALPEIKREITDVFTKHIRTTPAHLLNVPAERRGSLISMPLVEAIEGAFDYPDTEFALMNILQFSNCPHVATLRKLLAARHIKNHSEDIARIMVAA